MSENEPATKQDIADLDQRIEQLRSEMNHGYRELAERIEDVGTKMLTAFYNVAEPHSKRLMDVENTESALRSRLSTVENRLLEVERRLNLPPAR